MNFAVDNNISLAVYEKVYNIHVAAIVHKVVVLFDDVLFGNPVCPRSFVHSYTRTRQ